MEKLSLGDTQKKVDWVVLTNLIATKKKELQPLEKSFL